MKNSNTQKNNAKAVMLLIVTTFLVTNSLSAQNIGGAWGDKSDVLVTNNDASNSCGQLRMQTNDIGFTFSNFNDRMSLSYVLGADWKDYGQEVFTVDTQGNTTMNNVYVGDVGYGNNWAGFAHKSEVNKTSYALLADEAGEHTFINKEDTGNGFIGFRVGNVDKMIITNDGDVGMGTIEPTEKLEVIGNILASGNVTSNGNIQASNAVITGNISTGDVEATQITIGNSQLSSITENENTLLTVTGGVKTDKVVLNIGSFPDYVFENDYKLMPIEDVAKYITENKHLPNIPAEKEMIASGMDMKMISLKLVEKIEELTLYTIQQEESLEAQNQLIMELINRLDTIEGK